MSAGPACVGAFVRPRAAIIGVLVVGLAACGGVRQRLADRSASTDAAFDAIELIDVLPPDRIRSIDRPRFDQVALADEWLKPDSPVIVVEVAGDARAYPLAVLVWHEIVNDTVGGRPLAITYGPLYNAALVFDRTIDGRADTFGVSGKLYRSDLVMYDRRTRSLWPQTLGRAVRGPLSGRRAARIPAQMSSLGEFAAAFPHGRVLSRETGFDRAYGFNPYEGYDGRAGPFPGFFSIRTDRRLPAMERVVGIPAGSEARAYPYRLLSERRVVHNAVGGRDLVLFWRAGTRSPLDTPALTRGRDVGSAGVFASVLGGRKLDFEADAAGFRDRQTGSSWSVLGVATAGPLAGQTLERVDHLDSFWFAWAAVSPGTTIHEG